MNGWGVFPFRPELITRAETARLLIRVFNAEQMALTTDKQLIVDRS